MIGGSLFHDFARVGATPALFQSFVLSAGVVTDYVYGAGMHWQAMFPMIAVQRYLGEASAGTRLDDQRQLGIFLEVGRYFFIYGVGARFAEAVAILFSPVHWLTLEWARRRVDAVTPCTATDGSA